MSETKFTPGPWEVDEIGNVSSTAVRNIATVFGAATREGWGGSDYATFAHCKANARLITSAPDILEALKFAIRFHDQITPADVERMRAVVAKATGEKT